MDTHGIFDHLKGGWKRYVALFVFNFIAGTLIYLVLISNQLTNPYDGLWHNSYYGKWSWILRIGRWAWIFINKLRLGLSPEPITSLTSIAIFALGNTAILSIFDVRGVIGAFAGCLMIANTAVCVSLSYRYMSPTFALGYCTSTLAVWVLLKGHERSLRGRSLISLVFVVISLGLYQADIGCTCLIILAYLVCLLTKEHDAKKSFSFAIQGAMLIIAGCAIYYIIWRCLLKLTHTAAASYKGANAVSVYAILKNLPSQILYAYKAFYYYFLTKDFIKHNVYQRFPLFHVVLLLLLSSIILNVIRSKEAPKWRIVVCLLLIFLFPLATGFSLLLASESRLMIQMTMPFAILVPVCLCIFCNQVSRTELSFNWRSCLCYAVVGIILYGNVLMVGVDQHVMLEGREKTFRLIDRIVTELDDQGLSTKDKPLLFIGSPADNQFFAKDPLWAKANSYAQYGKFSSADNTMLYSYAALMEALGYNIPTYRNIKLYGEIRTNKDIKAMPAYPESGYILEQKDKIIIKVANSND